MTRKSFTMILSAVILLLVALSLPFSATATDTEQEQQSQFVAPILVANTSFLNVRTGPGIQYSVLVTVVGGTELPALGVARDRVWYQVSTIAGVGWVNSQFTLPRGDFTNVPFVEAPESVRPASSSNMNMFTMTAQDDAVETMGFSSGREWGISVRIAHPFRTQATMNSSSPGTIGESPTFIYEVLEAASGDGTIWYRINDATFGIGWVEADKTAFRPFACELTAVVFATSAAPSIGPDGSGTLDGNIRVEAGEEAYLVDAIGQQYKVELRDGNYGWVPSSVVTIRSDDVSSAYCVNGSSVVNMNQTMTTDSNGVTTTNTQPTFVAARLVINTGFLNLRSGPGAQFTIVTTLPGGTELPIVGVAPDGVWYLVEGTFGQAWMNSEFALLRGDASNTPIIRDFNASTLSTPTANITNAVTLYATPNVGGNVVGALSGPIQVNVVARTSDFNWVQINTSIGFGWVQAAQVGLQGDTSLIPIVNG